MTHKYLAKLYCQLREKKKLSLCTTSLHKNIQLIKKTLEVSFYFATFPLGSLILLYSLLNIHKLFFITQVSQIGWIYVSIGCLPLHCANSALSLDHFSGRYWVPFTTENRVFFHKHQTYFHNCFLCKELKFSTKNFRINRNSNKFKSKTIWKQT